VIPIRESDNGGVWEDLKPVDRYFSEVFLTIVNVVQMLMRIIWVIDNQSTTQPITVLGVVVTVIPERPLKSMEVSLATSYKHGQGEIPIGLGP
jgi:hypothetical protein